MTTSEKHINTKISQSYVDVGDGQTAKRIVPVDANGDSIVNASGQMKVVLDGKVCECNSTNTPLLADGIYQGEAGETLDYSLIFVTVYSDVESAANGLQIQVSPDNIIWYDDDPFTIPANTVKTFSFQTNTKYFRVRYTNGIEDQSVFWIHVIYKKTNSKPSSHRIQDSITSDDDATLQKSVLTGETPQGHFVNFKASRLGNFKVSLSEYGDTPAIDAFDRLRVSSPYTLFDSKQLHDKQPLFWDELVGGSATSVHVPADANTVMSVTANASDFVIRQTKQRFNYQPGKSQLIIMTFHSPVALGAVKRIGLFDGTGTNNLTPNNGIFFETDGFISWNIAKNGTTTESIIQPEWNIDPFDGTGPSGIILDLSSVQILIIDFEWLGVGRVRVGFVMDGVIYYCHYFNHANISGNTTVYMSTPNLPLRYSIQTDGTTATSLDHICSSVMSEGGLEKTGILRVAETISPLVSLGLNTYAVVGIRLKSAYKDITVIPESFSILCTTNDSFRWSICLNPTIAGTFTYSDLTNSSVQIASGANANIVSNRGLILASGYASGLTREASESLNTALRIGSTIAGVQDQLVLTVTMLGTNSSIYGSLNFRELL